MHKILIYLHIIHLLKSSTCFEHCPAHLQEVYVVIVYMQPLGLEIKVKDIQKYNKLHIVASCWTIIGTKILNFSLRLLLHLCVILTVRIYRLF